MCNSSQPCWHLTVLRKETTSPTFLGNIWKTSPQSHVVQLEGKDVCTETLLTLVTKLSHFYGSYQHKTPERVTTVLITTCSRETVTPRARETDRRVRSCESPTRATERKLKTHISASLWKFEVKAERKCERGVASVILYQYVLSCSQCWEGYF